MLLVIDKAELNQTPMTAMEVCYASERIGETSRAKAFIRLMSDSIRTDMITLFAVYHVLNAARVKLPQL